MDFGEWCYAAIKSVLVVGLVILSIFLLVTGFPNSLEDFLSFGLFMSILYLVYMLISAGGWFLVGFPSHWLIGKFGGGRLIWYPVAVFIFTLVCYLLVEGAAIVLGLVAMCQAMLFKYYLNKAEKTLETPEN